MEEAPRALCDPFPPLQWPLQKGSYHQPQQPPVSHEALIREWGQPRHPSRTHREPLARFTLQWGRGSQSWAGGNVLPCHFGSSPAFAVYRVAQLVGQNTFLTLILQFNATISCCSRFIAYSIFPSGPPQAAHPIQKAESI